MADLVCFHCQQCVEKYLKAYLAMNKIRFPKTHSLDDLISLGEKADPLLGAIRSEAVSLQPFAVRIRYPGDEATPDDAKRAVARTGMLRRFLRRKLGVKGE